MVQTKEMPLLEKNAEDDDDLILLISLVTKQFKEPGTSSELK